MGPTIAHARNHQEARAAMIVEYVRYAVAEARREAFTEAYGRAAAALRASPHCEGFELARCAEDPGAFVLRIAWDSAQGHLQGFRTSEAFKSFFAEVKPYVPDIVEMRHYEPTAVRWSRGGP